MRLLLDTQALLWLLSEDKRLGPKARATIADPGNDVMVSVASLWEIAIKVQVGKLTADIPGIAVVSGQNDVALLGVTVDHLTALTSLPRHHKDPFDHLLIAQAIVENATLMSDDHWMPSYPVPVISCSA